MEQIKAWLNSDRSYPEGLALYTRYGTNEFLKSRFQSTQDVYNKNKIVEELQKLLEKPVITLVKKANPPSNPEADQGKYLSLIKKRDEVVKQIERNMVVLDLGTDKSILFETAKQILRLHQQKTELWAAIDFYQKYNCFEQPPEVKEIPKEKEIQLLYQAISKANKRLQSNNCKNPARTEQLRDQRIKRLNELKNL